MGEFEILDPGAQLKAPHVLAILRPWIDVGNIGSLSLSRLERHLGAKELGRLAKPGRYYDFTRYRPRSYMNFGQRQYSIPNTIIRYAARQSGPDMVFLHLLDPHLYGEDYTEAVLAMLKQLHVSRYVLIGGMYDLVPHTRPLLVSSTAGGPPSSGSQVAEDGNKWPLVQPSSYEGPTTVAYLITQQAAALGIQTRTFVVHLPQYFRVEDDLAGTARLMDILCSLYQLPSWLVNHEQGKQQYTNLQSSVRYTEGMGELLQRLEDDYDRERHSQREPPSQLSSAIEQFLEELDEGFDPKHEA